MTSNYAALAEENRGRYGTDINQYGPMLLADRYADRTHFIFELLQNTEDALRRRGGPANGAVHFELTPSVLIVRHGGKPFDEADVRAVCSIGNSTKDGGAIGRFGIGFKSVYTVTDRPEIYSGDEHFAIDWFVRPVATMPRPELNGTTEIRLPLKAGDATVHPEIVQGLQRLGPDALLFLRRIEEIRWDADDGKSGLYLRDTPVALDTWVERLTVLGQESGEEDFEQSWMVFRRPIRNASGIEVGNAELAFLVEQDVRTRQWSLRGLASSPLVVYFPTAVETHLGFLVQGPYGTTPSRDNILQGSAWNAQLVTETAALLLDALGWLRSYDLLDVAALKCLPMEPGKFTNKNLFTPVFHAVRDALANRELLPRDGGGHTSASRARLGRTAELRALLSSTQLGALFGDDELHWLSGEITPDRTPEVHRYLRQHLEVPEITPESLLAKFDSAFLTQQSDDWLQRLYAFLVGQPALLPRATLLPLIRLEDGSQIVAKDKGQPQAFLPGMLSTGFPTVRKATCASPEAFRFLRMIGVSEPDPIDNVVLNILPKYQRRPIAVTSSEYARDLEQILAAQQADSTTSQVEKLRSALAASTFVRVVDAGTQRIFFVTPRRAYIATERLTALFSGVNGVFFVDQSLDALRGEPIRDLLTTCGASRYLQPIGADSSLSISDAQELRKQAGCEQTTMPGTIEDRTLRGLSDLLALLPTLNNMERRDRALLLWQALCDLADRSSAPFAAKYSWFFRTPKSTTFDAAFVRELQNANWIPDAQGALQRPEFVEFEALAWPAHPFVQGRLHFKPPIIVSLAREAGIDPAVIDLIKQLGLTPESIKATFGIKDAPVPAPATPVAEDPPPEATPTPPAQPPNGDTPASGAGADTPTGQRSAEPSPADGGSAPPGAPARSGNAPSNDNASKSPRGSHGTPPSEPSEGRSPGTAPSGAHRPLISYVGTHSDDPDGPEDSSETHQRKMALEAAAIERIRQSEPMLQTTPPGNPGFDLFEEDASHRKVRWVEVKALGGAWNGRFATMSDEQFKAAQARRGAYWLYVVEHASEPSLMKIHRIRDPAGVASYFTFDHGWAQIADELNGTKEEE